MQMFTETPFTLNERFRNTENPATAATAAAHADASASPARPVTPLWPDYFARRGQVDATSWHYHGHAADVLHVWQAYYSFVFRHPRIACIGLRQFVHSLTYRVLGEAIGDRAGLTVTLLTPTLLLSAPPLSLAAVCIASLPVLRKHMPPMFQPFTVLGWTNYCIMLTLVFTLHGYRQRRRRLHPAQVMRHSSKLFWNAFFTAQLPGGQATTHVYASYQGGVRSGDLPKTDIVIKPLASGAGYLLRSLRWDARTQRYLNHDIERTAQEPRQYTPAELDTYLRGLGVAMLVERLEYTRPPLPTGTLRVLTLCIASKAELICAVFLPAPAGSVSTAYFDLDAYLVSYQHGVIGDPIANRSTGQLRGLALPELAGVIDTCLMLHEKLPEHVQISWDIIPTSRGPVFLEGNVFPPGCDYKLTLFKDPANFRYLRDRIIAADGVPA